MTRQERIDCFLQANGRAGGRQILAEDASFRRYWRLADGGVLMDAPPEVEDVRPFLRIQAHLAAGGLSVPAIYAADPAEGLVLLEDLGDGLFSAVMTADNLEALYDAAVDALVVLHRADPPDGLAQWRAEAMAAAARGTFLDWWWPAQFGAPAGPVVAEAFRSAMSAMLTSVGEPTAMVHRDYFAGNLFWLPERDGVARVGVIDFQDAALGHPAYDLVALVEDARRTLPEGLAARQIARYLAQRPELDAGAFQTAYDACAAQRHLRVAALWVRLARRDGKSHYLAYSTITWSLLQRALTRPGAARLAAFMENWVPPDKRNNPGVAA